MALVEQSRKDLELAQLSTRILQGISSKADIKRLELKAPLKPKWREKMKRLLALCRD